MQFALGSAQFSFLGRLQKISMESLEMLFLSIRLSRIENGKRRMAACASLWLYPNKNQFLRGYGQAENVMEGFQSVQVREAKASEEEEGERIVLAL